MVIFIRMNLKKTQAEWALDSASSSCTPELNRIKWRILEGIKNILMKCN